MTESSTNQVKSRWINGRTMGISQISFQETKIVPIRVTDTLIPGFLFVANHPILQLEGGVLQIEEGRLEMFVAGRRWIKREDSLAVWERIKEEVAEIRRIRTKYKLRILNLEISRPLAFVSLFRVKRSLIVDIHISRPDKEMLLEYPDLTPSEWLEPLQDLVGRMLKNLLE